MTSENALRLSAQNLANAERLTPFNEISLLLKFVKEYNEITFDNFYTLKYNFVYNILFYEKTRAEYELYD